MKENNEEKSCYDCRYYQIDSDCRGIELCKNFKPHPLDKIAAIQDCIPEGKDNG
jgi:hypothetical protein